MPLKHFGPREDDDNLDELGIRLRLASEDGRIPSSFLTESVIATEKELFSVESDELAELLDMLGPFPSTAKEECFRSMDRYRGNALVIDHAEDGSIVLEAIAIGGLAYWVLEKTVGESFKEAWKRSDLHMKLQDLFLTRLSWRRRQVQDRISKRLENTKSDSGVVGNVRYERNGRATIEVDLVLHSRAGVAPSSSEWLVKRKKKRDRDSGEGGAQQRMAA